MRAGIPAAVLAAALPVLVVAQTRPGDVASAATSSIRSERLASLEYPWGMAYLPDGRLLITEKPGRLRIFADGKLSAPVENVPATAIAPGRTNRPACSTSRSIRTSRRTATSTFRTRRKRRRGQRRPIRATRDSGRPCRPTPG